LLSKWFAHILWPSLWAPTVLTLKSNVLSFRGVAFDFRSEGRKWL